MTEGTTRTPWHALTAAECLRRLDAREEGLDAAEAKARLGRHGPNAMPKPRRRPLALVFLAQFRSPLIYLLLIAAAAALAFGERLDAGFIAAVLLLNAAVGTVQEHRAGLSMAALEDLIRHVARVRRSGGVVEVDAACLVPGDVVELESGMAVPADIRLLSSSGLRADESLLSGESLPVAKRADAEIAVDAGLGGRPTMLHAGTGVAEGRAIGLVVATGMATELGAIQASLGRAAGAAPPPLVLRLERLTRQIAGAAVGLILLLSLLLAVRGETAGEILPLAVALAVSAIPEGLPVAVTVALAAATTRMARRNVIIRSLPAVEGLGACTLIASDKTGTLTLNRLSVERLMLPDGTVPERGDWKHGAAARLARAGALCNEARCDTGAAVGDTVDVALMRFAAEAGVEVASCSRRPRLWTLPYEPARRFAAAAVGETEGPALYVKGAPEVVLAMCANPPADAEARAERMAAQGFRVLALARRRLAEGESPQDETLRGLELLGWVGLLDPLRPEAAAAVADCRRAGIDVRMVTGDHPATALAIARQLGIVADERTVVTGAQLAAAGPAPAEIVCAAKVFARVEPTQKYELVRCLTEAGELVAVTGDGVNDAPALQAAHIGVAMGRGGTDVARGASDIVLADDNFASIVAGVEEGRVTYANVRKIVIFLLASGLAEIFMFIGALAAGLPMPLTAVQLLWLNIVTNGAQDVMLGFGRGEGDELSRLPRRPDEPILDRTALRLLIPPALTMTLFALLLMDTMLDRGFTVEQARNGVLLLTVLFQNVYVMSMRSERRPLWREPIASNPWLPLGVALALALHVAAMHWPPLQAVLGTAPPDPATLTLCAAGALVIVAVTELTKAIAARSGRPREPAGR